MDKPKRVGDGTPGPGRPKGVPNKTTKLARHAIAEAFEKLGGTDALVTWAQADDDNLKVFYATIWPKIVPVQVTGENGAAISFANAPMDVVAWAAAQAIEEDATTH